MPSCDCKFENLKKPILAALLKVLHSDHPPPFRIWYLLSWALAETESKMVVFKILLNPYLNPKRYSSILLLLPTFCTWGNRGTKGFINVLKVTQLCRFTSLVRSLIWRPRLRSWSLPEVIRLTLAQGTVSDHRLGDLFRDPEVGGQKRHILPLSAPEYGRSSSIPWGIREGARWHHWQKPLVSHLFLLCVLLRCKSLTVAAIRECALCGMNLIPLMTLQAYLYIQHGLAKGPTCSPRFGPRQLLHVHQGTPRQQACDSQKVTVGQGQRSE